MDSTTFTPEVRHLHFNTVYIIESLPKGERRTGKELHQQLKFKSFQYEQLRPRYEEVQTRKAFVKLLHRIEEQVVKGFMPWLHLEIHGGMKGLTFSSGDVLDWDDLHQHLRRLNKVTGNNLMVSFATCQAGFTYFSIDPMVPAPFIGVIAPFNTVTSREIEEGFSAFFDELFDSNDIPNAVDALNQSSTPPRFQFLHAEGFFYMLWGMLEEHYTNPVTYRERILSTMSQALGNRNVRNGYSLPDLRYEVEKYFNPDGREALRQHYLRTFMMLD
jgi:hypothetical protein